MEQEQAPSGWGINFSVAVPGESYRAGDHTEVDGHEVLIDTSWDKCGSNVYAPKGHTFYETSRGDAHYLSVYRCVDASRPEEHARECVAKKKTRSLAYAEKVPAAQ